MDHEKFKERNIALRAFVMIQKQRCAPLRELWKIKGFEYSAETYMKRLVQRGIFQGGGCDSGTCWRLSNECKHISTMAEFQNELKERGLSLYE